MAVTMLRTQESRCCYCMGLKLCSCQRRNCQIVLKWFILSSQARSSTGRKFFKNQSCHHLVSCNMSESWLWLHWCVWACVLCSFWNFSWTLVTDVFPRTGLGLGRGRTVIASLEGFQGNIIRIGMSRLFTTITFPVLCSGCFDKYYILNEDWINNIALHLDICAKLFYSIVSFIQIDCNEIQQQFIMVFVALCVVC